MRRTSQHHVRMCTIAGRVAGAFGAGLVLNDTRSIKSAQNIATPSTFINKRVSTVATAVPFIPPPSWKHQIRCFPPQLSNPPKNPPASRPLQPCNATATRAPELKLDTTP